MGITGKVSGTEDCSEHVQFVSSTPRPSRAELATLTKQNYPLFNIFSDFNGSSQPPELQRRKQ